MEAKAVTPIPTAKRYFKVMLPRIGVPGVFLQEMNKAR
jgi:hypothetical protein